MAENLFGITRRHAEGRGVLAEAVTENVRVHKASWASAPQALDEMVPKAGSAAHSMAVWAWVNVSRSGDSRVTSVDEVAVLCNSGMAGTTSVASLRA